MISSFWKSLLKTLKSNILFLNYISLELYITFTFSLKLSFLSSKLACGRYNSSLNTSPRQLTIVDIFYRFYVFFSDLRISYRTVVLFNRYTNALTQEENTINSPSLYQSMLYGVSNSSNTTGSTYNLVFMQRSISLYRTLKNTRFSSTSPTRIFGDF